MAKHPFRGGKNPPGPTDTVPAMLAPGEYVLNREAVQAAANGLAVPASALSPSISASLAPESATTTIGAAGGAISTADRSL